MKRKLIWALFLVLLLMLPGCAQRLAEAPSPAAAPSQTPTEPEITETELEQMPTAPVQTPTEPGEASAEQEEKTVIKIAALSMPQSGEPVEDIVALYNEAQDEIILRLAYYSSDQIAALQQPTMHQTYTELFGEAPPDLYYLYHMDENALLDAELAADWYPLMDADTAFDRADYLTHFWELLEQNGALYTLPASVDLYGLETLNLFSPGSTGWTMEEFSLWQQTALSEPDTSEIPEDDQAAEMLAWLMTGSIDMPQTEMLSGMLSYGVQSDFIDLTTNTCDFECDAFYNWLAFLKDCPEEVTNGALHYGTFASFLLYERNLLRDRFSLRYAGAPWVTASGPALDARHGFALSSTTEHTEACWTFIKWLLSDEVQQELYITLSRGIPVCRETWERLITGVLLDGDVEGSSFAGQLYRTTVDGEPTALPCPALPEEDVSHLRAIVEQADRAVFHYADVTAIIEEEILAYLAGDKPAEECAHLIQTRVSTFLAERQE